MTKNSPTAPLATTSFNNSPDASLGTLASGWGHSSAVEENPPDDDNVEVFLGLGKRKAETPLESQLKKLASMHNSNPEVNCASASVERFAPMISDGDAPRCGDSQELHAHAGAFRFLPLSILLQC